MEEAFLFVQTNYLKLLNLFDFLLDLYQVL